MLELDNDKISVKYLTGINKCLEGYPTSLDILYECCNETIDGTFYSEAKLENKYSLSEEQINNVFNELVELGYIEKKIRNYKIVNTPWS